MDKIVYIGNNKRTGKTELCQIPCEQKNKQNPHTSSPASYDAI